MSLFFLVAVGKKVEKIGKKKGCENVGKWVQSIKNNNHVHWCASSSNGDPELVKEKWLSIVNHIANRHEGHGTRFPKCLHDEIDRIWLDPGKYCSSISLTFPA